MKVEQLEVPDVLLVTPRVFRDNRGHFLETWRAAEYALHGMGPFVQDNLAVSQRGVLRGLHFQSPRGQGKLAYVLRGKVFDVAVDVRLGSPTFGRWVGAELSGENNRQLYIPVGFAHAYLTLTDDVIFAYKCTDYYAPEAERTVRWDDPTLAIAWPVENPVLAPRDATAPLLGELPSDILPRHSPRA